MGRRRKTRLYVRHQGGARRFYGDFRDYPDVGGGREALVPAGASFATDDERLAQAIIAQRLAELDGFRRRKQRGEPVREACLSTYVEHHIRLKRASANFTEQWVDAAEMHLNAAVEFFCRGAKASQRTLETITVGDVQEYVAWLAARSNRRGRSLSSSSQRKYLNSLSNLFRRAISERFVAVGFNPVASLLEKPQEGFLRTESRWLEVHDAALLLAFARIPRHMRHAFTLPSNLIHAVIATLLLTGGRPSEVLGLQVKDISFERRTVSFRPNSIRRRLKTSGSHRSVMLWPQLDAVLHDYIATLGEVSAEAPLFASPRTGGLLVDIRKAIDAIASSAGFQTRTIRPYAFRHTYCAARLQSLDNGAPISPFTVARELGHGGFALVNHVYGHLGSVRHRSEVVEFDVTQHREKLGVRLERLHEAERAMRPSTA